LEFDTPEGCLQSTAHQEAGSETAIGGNPADRRMRKNLQSTALLEVIAFKTRRVGDGLGGNSADHRARNLQLTALRHPQIRSFCPPGAIANFSPKSDALSDHDSHIVLSLKRRLEPIKAERNHSSGGAFSGLSARKTPLFVE
jgi:hypothetical protein